MSKAGKGGKPLPTNPIQARTDDLQEASQPLFSLSWAMIGCIGGLIIWAVPYFGLFGIQPPVQVVPIDADYLNRYENGVFSVIEKMPDEIERVVVAHDMSIEELIKNRRLPLVMRNTSSDFWNARRLWVPPAKLAELWPAEVNVRVADHERFPLGCCATQPMSVMELIVRYFGPRGFGSSEADLDKERSPREKAARLAVAKSPKQAPYAYFSSKLDLYGNTTAILKDTIQPNEEFDARELPLSHPMGKRSGNLWIGSKGVITPVHFDFAHNFFFQIHGNKTLYLFPPEQWRSMYLHPKQHLRSRQGQVNLNKPDFTRFPRLKEAKGYEVQVTPGDVVYLPPFWFHQVEATTESVSVNIFSPPRHASTYDELSASSNVATGLENILEPKERLKPARRTTLLALFFFECAQRLLGANKAKGFIADLLDTRYRASLYAPGGKRLDVENLGDRQIDNWSSHRAEGNANSIIPRTESVTTFCNDTSMGWMLKAQQQVEPVMHSVGPVLDELHRVTPKPNDHLKRIYLEVYLEDMAAVLVGDDRVYDFLSRCEHVINGDVVPDN